MVEYQDECYNSIMQALFNVLAAHRSSMHYSTITHQLVLIVCCSNAYKRAETYSSTNYAQLLEGLGSSPAIMSFHGLLAPHLYTMFCCPTPVGGAPVKPQWGDIPKISEPQWGDIPLRCPTPAGRGAGGPSENL